MALGHSSLLRQCVSIIVLLLVIQIFVYLLFTQNHSYDTTQYKQSDIIETTTTPTINTTTPIRPHLSPIKHTSNTITSQSPFDAGLKLDVVYLWVNGSDPDYIHLRQSFEKEYYKIPSSTWSPSIDHGELKLSLRSLYLYGNIWLRNIYIVTTNKQYPNWLNLSHPKIHIIDDTTLLNISHPSFNSHSLYLMMYAIPNISRYFIQFDDDFILTQNKTLHDLLFIDDKDNTVIGTKNWVIKKQRCAANQWSLPIQCGLVNQMFNATESVHWAAHTIRVWDKHTLQQMWKDFELQLNATIHHPFRHTTDIDLTSFYPIYDRWKYKTKYNNKYLFTQNQCIHFRPIGDEVMRHPCWHNVGSIVLQDENRLNEEYYTREQRPMLHYILTKRYSLDFKSPYELGRKGNEYDDVDIMGHRGYGFSLFGEETVPESTLLQLERARNFGIKWIEIDIAITKDDVLIVHHTENVLFLGCNSNYTKDKHIDVATLTYAEIETDYNHMYKEEYLKIPTLKEFLLMAKEYNIGLQIELKYKTNYGKAAHCIRSPNMTECVALSQDKKNKMISALVYILIDLEIALDKFIISSFEGYKLKNFNDEYYKLTNKRAHTALIMGKQTMMNKKIAKLINVCKFWDIDNISVFVGDVSFEKIKKFKDAGLRAQIGMPGGGVCMQEISRPYIGDERKDLEIALSYFPNVITTNQPVLASAIKEGF